MEIKQTKTLDDAVSHLQSLPPTLRKEVFYYIDFLRMRSIDEEQEHTPVKKRQFGICEGKSSFEIKDGFEVTEEELIDL